MVIMYFKETIGNLILIDKLFLTLTEQGTYWCGRPYVALLYIFFSFYVVLGCFAENQYYYCVST